MSAQRPRNTIRFNAILAGSGNFLDLPGTASAKLPSRGVITVEGTINAFPFRAALEPTGKGSHRLKVDKGLKEAAGLELAEAVALEITRTGDEPELRVPLELRKALATARPARETWEDITPAARRDWILWITTAKQAETRRRRIEKACDMLATGKRRVCCFPGLNWLTQDHSPAGGTWQPLPKSPSITATRR